MRPTMRTAQLLATTAVIGLALTACGSSAYTASSPADSNSGRSSQSSSPAASSGGDLVISNFSFGAITVKAGANVTVTNKDSAAHTVHIAGTNIDVNVPAMGTADFTAPSKAGTYTLSCDFHPAMSGTLTVTS